MSFLNISIVLKMTKFIYEKICRSRDPFTITPLSSRGGTGEGVYLLQL